MKKTYIMPQTEVIDSTEANIIAASLNVTLDETDYSGEAGVPEDQFFEF